MGKEGKEKWNGNLIHFKDVLKINKSDFEN